MNVLVTGGTGFIGRRVVEQAIARGHSVRVLTRGPEVADLPRGVTVARADLRSDRLTPALEGTDAVIHCAASMSTDPRAQQQDTVLATTNLLAAMEHASTRHIVGVSTLAVYDYRRVPEGSILDEDSPLEEDYAARGPYVAAKRQQEEAIRDRATDHGWRWTILRPGIVFGPGRTWFHHLGVRISPARWICYAGDAPLPLVHVESCARALVLALESATATGEILNLVDDDPPARRRYVEGLAARAQPSPAIHAVPWKLLDLLARTGGAATRLPLVSSGALPGLLRPAELHARCKPLRYTNQRARERLGWTPGSDWARALENALDQEAAERGSRRT